MALHKAMNFVDIRREANDRSDLHSVLITTRTSKDVVAYFNTNFSVFAAEKLTLNYTKGCTTFNATCIGDKVYRVYKKGSDDESMTGYLVDLNSLTCSCYGPVIMAYPCELVTFAFL
jgi:hypothetical protein